MIELINHDWPEGYPKYSESNEPIVSLEGKQQKPLEYTRVSFTTIFGKEFFRNEEVICNFRTIDACIDYNNNIVNNSIPPRAKLIDKGSHYIVQDNVNDFNYEFPHLVEAEIFKARMNTDNIVPSTTFYKGWDIVTNSVHTNIRRESALIDIQVMTATSPIDLNGTYITANIPYHIINPTLREGVDDELIKPYIQFIINMFVDNEQANVIYVGATRKGQTQNEQYYEFEFTKVML